MLPRTITDAFSVANEVEFIKKIEADLNMYGDTFILSTLRSAVVYLIAKQIQKDEWVVTIDEVAAEAERIRFLMSHPPGYSHARAEQKDAK